VLRNELPRLAAAYAGGPPTAPQESVIEDHLRLVTDHLLRHHREEDEFHWPRLASRAPGAARLLALLETEHTEMEPLIGRARDRRLPRPERSVALSELTELVLAHLEAEDRSIVPLLALHISGDEQRASRAAIPPADESRVLAMMLAAATGDERSRLLAAFPHAAAAPALTEVHRVLADVARRSPGLSPTVVPTWSRRTVLAVWALAALPMAALSWLVAPLLAHAFAGPTALPRALILSLAAGLIWQFALVLIVIRREQGTLRRPVLKAALWINPPVNARNGRRSNRLWWMVIPLMALLAAEEFLPSPPTPVARDLTAFLGSGTGQQWLSGNWIWFAILAVQFVFNTALGEELFFRGLLLPRMGSFGRADWAANGLLFACYHLHEPWVIPQTLLVDTFAEALPSRRWRSSLIGIAVHSGQTVFFLVVALGLVLR
jgi:membrane protease YdiL (CAAX protease family)